MALSQISGEDFTVMVMVTAMVTAMVTVMVMVMVMVTAMAMDTEKLKIRDLTDLKFEKEISCSSSRVGISFLRT